MKNALDGSKLGVVILTLGILGVLRVDLWAADGAVAGASVGQEIRQVEDGVKANPLSKDAKPPALQLPRLDTEPKREPVVLGATKANGLKIERLEVRGDEDVLVKWKLKSAMESDLVGQTLTRLEIIEIAQKYQKQMVSNGYYLARMDVVSIDAKNGSLVCFFDKGRIGKMNFNQAAVTAGGVSSKEPFAQKHFSEAQLRRRMEPIREGADFDYYAFYRQLFQINSHPDVKIDTHMAISREESKDGSPIRYADLEFNVREQLPLHAVLEINNTGTESTDPWRAGLTVQHLNLTRHDDALTLKALSALDFESMSSFAGSYAIPHSFGNGGLITAYGGYSEIDTLDALGEDISLQGDGWFVGSQGSYRLINNSDHLLNVSLGVAYRFVSDWLVYQDFPGETRDATVLPTSLAFSYSSAKPDRFRGRNFLTSETVFNMGDMTGVTEAEEIERQRPGAESDYFIERLQGARIQPVLGHNVGGIRRGQWLIFGKVGGQWASGSLIPAEQIGLGGMNTVRGYTERTVMGDHGLYGTLELRTPMVADLLTRPWAGSLKTSGAKRIWIDRLQAVCFADVGWVYRQDALESEEDSVAIGSAGLGLRWSLGELAQVRLDGAYRLVDLPDSYAAQDDAEQGLGAHVSAQVQF